ncbi:hypothetical protein JHU04_000634 [Brenneria sp. 4F2]|nr:hypothetical protein [Brenneria bubanii]
MSTGREEIVAIAQQLKQIGFEESVQAGVIQKREQGIEQEMKASVRQIARQLLLSGMAREQIQQITRLSDDEMAQLSPLVR